MVMLEWIVISLVGGMLICIILLKLFVWFFNGLVNLLFCVFSVLIECNDEIIFDDIYVVMDVGVEVGVLDKGE